MTAAAIINLRLRTSQNQPLVLPYAPTPRPNPKSPAARAAPAEPPKPSLLHPNPHLRPAIYEGLEYADTL